MGPRLTDFNSCTCVRTHALRCVAVCSEFQYALGYKGKESSIFIERIFKVFDDNTDGFMYVHCIA